jgi:hypothetical protein
MPGVHLRRDGDNGHTELAATRKTVAQETHLNHLEIED